MHDGKVIIFFINPDQGLPSTLEASTRRVFSSSDAQKKSTELTLLEVEMCKHKKSMSKKKEMGKNPS